MQEDVSAQSCPTLCDATYCSLPGTSVHGIFQARTLQWIAILFSRGSSWARNWNQGSCIAVRFFTIWVTRNSSKIDESRDLKRDFLLVLWTGQTRFLENEWPWGVKLKTPSWLSASSRWSWRPYADKDWSPAKIIRAWLKPAELPCWVQANWLTCYFSGLNRTVN